MMKNSTSLFSNLEKDLNDNPFITLHAFDEITTDHSLDPRDVAASLLRDNFVKKYEPEGQLEVAAAEEAAVKLFLECNDTCKAVPPPELCKELFCIIRRLVPDTLSMEEIIKSSMLVGPGASRGSMSRNSFFEKLFENELGTTSIPLMRDVLNELIRDPLMAEAFASRPRPYTLYRGSKSFMARKTKKIARFAATEASVNMMAQLGLGAILNRALFISLGFDFATQQVRNRAMAKRGSLDGSIATIDLTSASDLISRLLCESTLPSFLLAALLDCRSEYVEIGGTDYELNTMSTNGNGFTFPLETLIFSAVCILASKRTGIKLTRMDDPQPNFGVNGDDIIVPAQMFGEVCSILEELHMQPNKKKSFGAGSPFRESCGGDYYKGVNVRSVYVKEDINKLPQAFSAINRTIRFSALHNIPLINTVSYLLPHQYKRHLVPRKYQDDQGIHYPVRPDHRTYGLKPVPERFALFKDGVPTHGNELGLLLSVLRGEVNGGFISRRQRTDDSRYQEVPVRPYEWDQVASFHLQHDKCWKVLGQPLAWYSHGLPNLGWIEVANSYF